MRISVSVAFKPTPTTSNWANDKPPAGARSTQDDMGRWPRDGAWLLRETRARSALRHLVDVDHVGMVVKLNLFDVRGLPATHFEFERNHAGAGLRSEERRVGEEWRSR